MFQLSLVFNGSVNLVLCCAIFIISVFIVTAGQFLVLTFSTILKANTALINSLPAGALPLTNKIVWRYLD